MDYYGIGCSGFLHKMTLIEYYFIFKAETFTFLIQHFINIINIYITKYIGLTYFFIINFWFRFLSLTNEFSFLPITF